jgi:two-component system, NtrC family, nitrogen regulation response regulator NtrX
MKNILIIDDEPGIRTVLKDVLEDEKYKVFLAEDGYEGLSIIDTESVDLVILDVWLPNIGGIDVLKRIKKNHDDIEVIIISGHANVQMAVQAVKIGAYDFMEKPLSLDKVITVVRNAIKFEDLKKENRDLKNKLFVEDKMIGSCKKMMKVRELIDQSAESDSRILVLGDNGTGKELVAKEIHLKSNRVNGPFIEVNCAAIPENLIESELFGHEKGAFTNAFMKKKGKFELAHGGTLFLDEIADMSLNTQAKVLRAIQELKFERIGSEESISVDVRIIAATNKNLEQLVKKGQFREDLFFRLNVIPIYVPPLKERLEDLPVLIDYFLKKFMNPSWTEPKSFSKDALKELKKYDWPGNIRELKNFIERINIMVDVNVISQEAVKANLCVSAYGRNENNEQAEDKNSSMFQTYLKMKLNDAKNVFEREFIVDKLKKNGYNISKTAEELGIYPSNLHGKIKKFGIVLERN